MWFGANNDQIWLPMGKMSDSEQCSNRLQLDLILILVNFPCELGSIMTRYDLRHVITRYDFLEDRRVILNISYGWHQLDLISLLIKFVYELGPIMIR